MKGKRKEKQSCVFIKNGTMEEIIEGSKRFRNIIFTIIANINKIR